MFLFTFHTFVYELERPQHHKMKPVKAVITALKRLAMIWQPVSVRVVVKDTNVVLKGVNTSERNEAPMSYLRGVVSVKVNRSSVSLKEINVKFIGERVDVVFSREINRRLFTDVRNKIVDEMCSYTVEGHRLLKGTYTIPFQFMVDPTLPETVNTSLGSRNYRIEVHMDKQNSNNSPLKTPITMIRTPLDRSLVANDCVGAIGSWHSVMPYSVLVSSRVCQLGKPFDISVETQPNPMINCSGVVKSVRVLFVQKIKCPSSAPTEPYTLFNRQTLWMKSYGSPKDPYDPFRLETTIKIPQTLNFDVFPYTSNGENEDGSPTPELRISHYIYIQISMHPIFITEDEFIDDQPPLDEKIQVRTWDDVKDVLVFKAPVFLLHRDATEEHNLAPPSYSQVKPGKHNKPLKFKSLAWICSDGVYDDSRPPKYVR